MKAPSDILLVDSPPLFSDVEMDSAVISDKKTYKKTIKHSNHRSILRSEHGGFNCKWYSGGNRS